MSATRKAKQPRARKPADLSKSIEALADFQENSNNHGHHPDSELKGLFLHVGPRSMVWRYRRQRMKNGVRKMVFKTLGEYPDIGVEEARKAAVIFAGMAADGKGAPGKRDAVTFEKAWAHYLEHLLRKANLNKKPARHHANAVKLGVSLILPQWGRWTLHAMSEAPGSVADWHAKMTRVHGPVSANRAAELVRATYKRWGKRDITLPERLPTKAIDWNPEEPSQAALAEQP